MDSTGKQTIIGWGFRDIRNNQCRGKSYQLHRRSRLITLTLFARK